MKILSEIEDAHEKQQKLLAVLVDPEKFDSKSTAGFLSKLPKTTSHIFVGGSTATKKQTHKTVTNIKKQTELPVLLFPGDADQLSNQADGVLYLSLISGNNAEYLIGQQLKSVPFLIQNSMEIIPTGYLLIDGGKESAVERVSNTKPLVQNDILKIVHTAVAGQYSGKKLIYLEAGSGAKKRVSDQVISAVSNAIRLPLIVGGGINSQETLEAVFAAGATMAVIGTAFEKNTFKEIL